MAQDEIDQLLGPGDIKPKYLSSKGAAEYLGCSDQTLRISRLDGGKLGGIKPPKHSKIGRIIRYKITDLDKWMFVEA